MSKSKRIDGICGAGALLMVLITLLYLCSGLPLVTASASELPYVERLFSTDKVHRIDIAADESDWEEMLQNAAEEKYISCTAVIDGEKFGNIAIRPKGNSSLSTVANSDSDRYSFKLEFDRYDKNTTYHGLDKLCLNNAIQDNTYMKDFLCYQMMNALGADAPLASFVWITVNGEDWGLYTAVEGIEDAFAQRVYGSDHGQLYKPDSMDMGGGGRGAEARNREENRQNAQPEAPPEAPEGGFPEGAEAPQAGGPAENSEDQAKAPGQSQGFGDMAGQDSLEDTAKPGGFGGMAGEGGFGGGMGGSEDVLLRYADDDPDSYPNIFDNAVFGTVTDADEARLIQALKSLNEGDVEGSVNMEEVLRYFAVHNFVLNGDSYTGSIIHNYYLYEDEGLLSMVAWDYNLAFGGMGAQDAFDAVNSPIDSPVTSGDISQRPMVAWIFSSEEYTGQYHQAMDQFISEYFESGRFEAALDAAVELISPYVEKDPTAFCTYEEFQKGVETLRKFCLLRAESVRGQLSGAIPSTAEGQAEDDSAFVDASSISISDMGSQSGGMGKDGMGGRPDEAPQNTEAGNAEQADAATPAEEGDPNAPEEETPAENGQPAEKTTPPAGMGGNQPDRQFPGRQAFGGEAPEAAAAGNGEVFVLLGGSFLLLIFGLLFAKFYG